MVVYSIKIGWLSGFGLNDVRICADGTFSLFFTDHILRLDASGKEITTIKLPPKMSYFTNHAYSDTLYLEYTSFFSDDSNDVTIEFCVYNFSNVQLYKVKVKTVLTSSGYMSLRPQVYLATNGDIYIKHYNKATEKTVIYRLPNPLHNDK
jgi:hypothetical protein